MTEEKMNQIMEKEQRIAILNSELTRSGEYGDYKILKTYEARLQGRDDPYDTNALIAKRQAARDEINRLQEEIKALEAAGVLIGISLPAASISSDTFSDYPALTSISLPAAENIESNAFRNCHSLVSVTLPNPNAVCTLESSSYIPFDAVFYVPAALLNDYKSATNWSNIANQIQAMP